MYPRFISHIFAAATLNVVDSCAYILVAERPGGYLGGGFPQASILRDSDIDGKERMAGDSHGCII